jgi:hypothetical protein
MPIDEPLAYEFHRGANRMISLAAWFKMLIVDERHQFDTLFQCLCFLVAVS